MTLEERIKQLRQTIAAFGRPPLGIASESLRARREWDLADTGRCDRFWAATEELSRLLERLDREAAGATAERLRDRRTAAALARIAAPERPWALSLAPDETPAVLVVREWLSSASPVLVLSGGVGTGKTVAALWGLRQLAHRGLRPEYLRAAALPRFGSFGPEAVGWAAVCGCGVLVLDDLGTEPLGAYAAANLSELVDARYAESQRRTIVTNNLSWPDLEARYGERVADRLREGATVVGTGTGSMRGESRKAGQPGPFLGILGGG